MLNLRQELQHSLFETRKHLSFYFRGRSIWSYGPDVRFYPRSPGIYMKVPTKVITLNSSL